MCKLWLIKKRISQEDLVSFISMKSIVRYEYEKNILRKKRFHDWFQAKEELNAVELDHHRLRIDYSTTKRAHTPSKDLQSLISIEYLWVFFFFKAPGIYMGVRTSSYRSNGHSYRRSPSPDRKSSHRRHHHHHHRRHHDNSSRFVEYLHVDIRSM